MSAQGLRVTYALYQGICFDQTELQEAFDSLTLVLPRLGPRRVTLTAPPRPRLLVYSDAS